MLYEEQLIAAAFDESGLTIINLLKRFPAEEIHLDLNVLSQYFGRGKTPSWTNREAIDSRLVCRR